MYELDKLSTELLYGKKIVALYYMTDYSSWSIPETRPILKTDDGLLYYFNGWTWKQIKRVDGDGN